MKQQAARQEKRQAAAPRQPQRLRETPARARASAKQKQPEHHSDDDDDDDDHPHRDDDGDDGKENDDDFGNDSEDDAGSDGDAAGPVDPKKLTSKERRQLKNRLSARRFRQRRKEYVGQLEREVQAAKDQLRQSTQALELERRKNSELQQQTRSLLQRVELLEQQQQQRQQQASSSASAPAHRRPLSPTSPTASASGIKQEQILVPGYQHAPGRPQQAAWQTTPPSASHSPSFESTHGAGSSMQLDDDEIDFEASTDGDEARLEGSFNEEEEEEEEDVDSGSFLAAGGLFSNIHDSGAQLTVPVAITADSQPFREQPVESNTDLFQQVSSTQIELTMEELLERVMSVFASQPMAPFDDAAPAIASTEQSVEPGEHQTQDQQHQTQDHQQQQQQQHVLSESQTAASSEAPTKRRLSLADIESGADAKRPRAMYPQLLTPPQEPSSPASAARRFFKQALDDGEEELKDCEYVADDGMAIDADADLDIEDCDRNLPHTPTPSHAAASPCAADALEDHVPSSSSPARPSVPEIAGLKPAASLTRSALIYSPPATERDQQVMPFAGSDMVDGNESVFDDSDWLNLDASHGEEIFGKSESIHHPHAVSAAGSSVDADSARVPDLFFLSTPASAEADEGASSSSSSSARSIGELPLATFAAPLPLPSIAVHRAALPDLPAAAIAALAETSPLRAAVGAEELKPAAKKPAAASAATAAVSLTWFMLFFLQAIALVGVQHALLRPNFLAMASFFASTPAATGISSLLASLKLSVPFVTPTYADRRAFISGDSGEMELPLFGIDLDAVAGTLKDPAGQPQDWSVSAMLTDIYTSLFRQEDQQHAQQSMMTFVSAVADSAMESITGGGDYPGPLLSSPLSWIRKQPPSFSKLLWIALAIAHERMGSICRQPRLV